MAEEYISLTLEPDFQKYFVEAMYIPHMTDPFPHVQELIRKGEAA